jgi:hypothetical protein
MTFEEWRKEAEQMLLTWHHDDPAYVVIEADGIGQIANLPLHREWLARRIVTSNRTCPSEISVNPSIIRMVVVLPEPLGPSSPKISPRPAENEMPLTTVVWP